jgi:hypothetical protein
MIIVGFLLISMLLLFFLTPIQIVIRVSLLDLGQTDGGGAGALKLVHTSFLLVIDYWVPLN